MESWRLRVICFVVFFFSVCERFQLSASLNDERIALLRIRESIEEDPSDALSNWKEGVDHCSWFGVECSDDGRVVAMKLKDLGLKGMLSPEIGKLINIKLLLLEGNSLSGEIPAELQEQLLSDIVPDEEFVLSNRKYLIRNIQSTTRRHLQGNLKKSAALQSSDQQNDAPEEKDSPPSQQTLDNPPPHLNSPSTSNAKKNDWVIYVAAIVSTVGFVIAVAAIYFLFFRMKKVKTVMPWATGLSGQLQKAFVTGVPSLGRPEIETACENFSNVIGTISDCKLYKGTLSSGVEIAVVSTMVKSASEWSAQSEEQFRNKISVLSRVNHKNFMNLLGYCEVDEPFTRMMVFEYAPCGTLFEHLHINEAEHLDWTARLRVIMGIVYCLEHMNQLNPPVLVRNLNSSSIYLTEDYAAKISDIVFWQGQADEKNSTEQDSIVYKFAILLLEVISGRLQFSEDYGLLVLWASSYLDGKRPLSRMVDPTLQSVPEKDISALCELIRLCINKDTNERPTMAEVAKHMRSITTMAPDAATPKDNPLWWAELEIVSSSS